MFKVDENEINLSLNMLSFFILISTALKYLRPDSSPQKCRFNIYLRTTNTDSNTRNRNGNDEDERYLRDVDAILSF